MRVLSLDWINLTYAKVKAKSIEAVALFVLLQSGSYKLIKNTIVIYLIERTSHVLYVPPTLP